ncbi:MAG: tRNA 2-thiouridine(34) synthase MnmA [bacterium]
MSKIIVAMSGGVDSTVAAFLLKAQGHEVVGMTLKLWDDASRCCNYEDILDAKKACWKLGIKHYTLNAKVKFKAKVVEPFISAYLCGETPSPCAVCNRDIKFGILLKKMHELDFDFVASGHYAKIEKHGEEYWLINGEDKNKTQEYFLARLKQKDLSKILFPLGEMKKSDIKKIAAENGFIRNKKESQEICFMKDKETPGEFIMRSSKEAGKEKGELYVRGKGKVKDLEMPWFSFTIGQRKGFGYGAGTPLYVVEIDAQKKRVVLGEKNEAYAAECKVRDLNMLLKENKKFEADVKIRYLHKPVKAKIEIHEKEAMVTFEEPQFAITPGQLAVFYRGDRVIGSGFIKK